MQARIAELEAGKAAENPATETAANDFENWSNDQLKEYLASKKHWLQAVCNKSRTS
ncbi:hypothetical protein BANRA_00031 [Acinetobacter baumannii]|nr:hypothetical protein BANRA_00031 [Acinetobacter baumannii]